MIADFEQMTPGKLTPTEGRFIFLATFLFVCGIGTAAYEASIHNGFELMRLTSEVFLLCNYLVLTTLLVGRHRENRFLVWLTTTFLFTLAIEILGVGTGSVFGEYSYGLTFQLQLLEVPILIGLCWAFVVLGAVQFAEKLTENPYLQILAAGFIGLISDVLIEPVAIALDYWRWPGNIVPLQNYLAWFLITILFATSYKLLKIQIDSAVIKYFFVLQTIFMCCLNITLSII